MNMIRTKTPSKTQISDLHRLQETCRKHDHISITFPMDEDCIFYLLYDEASLLSALSAFFNENGDYECCAYTLPPNRQKGHFRMLLEELLKETDDSDLVFPVDETCEDTVQTLNAIGASLWYQEHLMALSASAFLKTGLAKDNRFSASLTLSMASDDEGPSLCTFLIKDTPVGSCYLDFRGRSAYFYGFEISENLRNQGLGSACLYLLLETCFSLPGSEKLKKLSLQVSGQNAPAMAIYKKAGFQITESLSYYLY
uniref:GNAT family N-acetyltransferase n=1 Tax=Clostridium sp. NkU-1 TaxID=1095009 RepID=UPI0006D17CDD